MFLLKYLQLTRSRECECLANKCSLSACPVASIMEGGHRRSDFCPGGMNDPVAVITGTVYSAVTLDRPGAKDFAYTVSFSPHNNSKRADAISLACKGSIRGLGRLSSLPQDAQQVSSKTSFTLLSPAAKPRSLTPLPWTETVVAGFLTVKKKSSPLIADFITHETAGLGRKKIASRPRPVPFQKEDPGWASCQPV